jgi:isopentenyl phosphate kinase
MLIIKLWWSVFAPKNSTFFDRDYLKQFYKLLKSFNKEIFFIHWAWNVGHSFVREHWLNQESYSLWKNSVRDNLWNPFTEIFSDFQRIEIEDIMKGTVDVSFWEGNFITGWDISTDYQIISGDDVFAFVMQKLWAPVGYMVTDVPWILDQNGQTIPLFNTHSLGSVSFWKKEWDAQNSMLTKVSTLQSYLSWSSAKVWIIDSRDLNNISYIIESNKGVWTCISF